MTKEQKQDILDNYSRAISSRGIKIHIQATDEPVYRTLEKLEITKDPRWNQNNKA